MTKNPRGGAILGLGGGPTSVIAESLISAVTALDQRQEIDDILIMTNGIDAIDNNMFYDARMETPQSLRTIAETTGAPPGSTRTNPQKKEGLVERTFDLCRRNFK